MNDITVSVITVVRNAENLIGDTIRSVIGQNNVNVEYIVVDGNSKDKTLDIIKEYESKSDGRMRWISEPDNGIYDAMNKGALMSNGKWVIFMNAGDMFCNPMVLSSMKLDSVPQNTTVVYGKSVSRYKNDYYCFTPYPLDVLKCSGMAFCHQAVLVRTETMKSFLFDTRYKLLADYDFFRKLFLADYKFLYRDIPVCFYGLEGGATASHRLQCAEEQFKISRNQEKLPLLRLCSIYCKMIAERLFPSAVCLFRRKKYSAMRLTEAQKKAIFNSTATD
ncbi:MAG: glycosyltransferase [Lentisphaeria bacterium]|nr:glycosyltransferase [Lentisphaeria bacterium]